MHWSRWLAGMSKAEFITAGYLAGSRYFKRNPVVQRFGFAAQHQMLAVRAPNSLFDLRQS
jgi:hypothetical protein